MVREGRVRAGRSDVAIHADTICVHGDGPHAVAFARRLAREFRQLGIELLGPGARREPPDTAPHLPGAGQSVILFHQVFFRISEVITSTTIASNMECFSRITM